MGGEQQQE
jgi:UTP-glucose-1-phosphate uridylyltransferase